MLDLWDWVVDGWNSLDFSSWFDGLDFGEIDDLIDSVDAGFDSLGSAISNVASSIAEGSGLGDGVSPLVSDSMAAGGGASMSREILGANFGYEHAFVGDDSWMKELVGNVTKNENTISGFWNALGGKERAAILQAGLAGIAGGASAYLQQKNAKDLMKDRAKADSQLVEQRGEEDRKTLDHRQQMNKVPTRRVFGPANGTPQIRRPNGNPVYGTQDQLGLITGAM